MLLTKSLPIECFDAVNNRFGDGRAVRIRWQQIFSSNVNKLIVTIVTI